MLLRFQIKSVGSPPLSFLNVFKDTFSCMKNEMGFQRRTSPLGPLCHMATARIYPKTFQLNTCQINRQMYSKVALQRIGFWKRSIRGLQCISLRYFRPPPPHSPFALAAMHPVKTHVQSQSSLWHPLIWSSTNLLCCRQKFAVGER